MTVGTEFSMPEGDRGPSLESRSASPPVIVIEYRNRGLAARLMPPALILFAAIAISSYQRKTPVWPLIPSPTQRDFNGAPTASSVVDRPEKQADAVKTVVVPDPPKTRTVAMADTPSAEKLPSPFDLDVSDGLQPVETPASKPTAVPEPTRPVEPPEVATTAPADGLPQSLPIPPTANNPEPPPSEEPPEPSKDEILRDIELEAQQKSVTRQDLEGLKSKARMLLLKEAVTKVQVDRIPFQDELKRILAEEGAKAGEEIERLCDRYGKDPLPEVKKAYAKLLRTASTRMSRAAKVDMMRAVGVPESLILDQICHDFDKLMNTRNGPRSENEVRVKAARALLAIPLSPAIRKAASADPAPSP